MSARRRLRFADTDACAADVALLRPGYTKAGNWSLPQVCWHLNTAINYSMRPPPHPPTRFKPVGSFIIKTAIFFGRIPSARRSPDFVKPAPDVPDAAIDEFLSTLLILKSFAGPFAPHHLAGKIKPEDYKRFHLVHCAHHLGYLSPANN
jgi:hypothetical protein